MDVMLDTLKQLLTRSTQSEPRTADDTATFSGPCTNRREFLLGAAALGVAGCQGERLVHEDRYFQLITIIDLLSKSPTNLNDLTELNRKLATPLHELERDQENPTSGQVTDPQLDQMVNNLIGELNSLRTSTIENVNQQKIDELRDLATSALTRLSADEANTDLRAGMRSKP